MILSQNPAIAFVESDLPEMLHQKQQLVHRLIGNRSNLHFLEINATHHLNSRLLNSYFQPDKPVTLLCEGLLMYLTFIEKQQVCTNVREILQTFGGVWITSDFTTKAGVGQIRQNDSSLREINQNIVSSTGRAFTENEFDDFEHVTKFVHGQGFQIEAFSMLEVVEQLKCLPALGIDLDRARALLAATPIFALTLA